MSATPPGVEIRGERSPPGLSPATRGRGLFATRSFAPGDLIALFDGPLVVLPASREATHTCNYCLDVRRQPVKLCTGCRAAAYCSPACQTAHWTRFHKVECKALARALKSAAESSSGSGGSTGAAPLIVPTPVRALMALLLLWDRDGKDKSRDKNRNGRSGAGVDSGAVLDPSSLRGRIESLESNTIAFVKNRTLWDDFKLQAAAACRFVGWSSEEQIKTAIEVMCRIHTNSFDRTDEETGLSGMFLDAILAMANHSCLPTAVIAFSGHRAYLRAQQPIAADDEITISYIDFTKPRSARQSGLTMYNFVCSCPRCTGDLDVYQVCAQTPPAVLDLNAGLSLVADVALLRRPPVLRAALTDHDHDHDHDTDMPSRITPTQVEAMYNACQVEANAVPGNRLVYMRRLWGACRPLAEARYWAVEPLATLVRQALMYCTDIGNYAHALAFACFCAQHVDPYKYPNPQAVWRIKGLMVLAKLVPNIMPVIQEHFGPGGDGAGSTGSSHDGRGDASAPAAARKVRPDVLAVLPQLADGGMYEALLLMVLTHGPKGHSDEWPLLDEARAMLDDVRNNAGPEHAPVTGALMQWHAAPTSPSMKMFFDEYFIKPASALAALAPSLLEDLMRL